MTEHYEYTNLMQKLNAAQQEAVRATEGYVRVIAGAGSGKTRALSHRFAFLVNELGILPGNILCVTFTNKSANEMRQRIHSLTGDNDTGYINTFHGFCVSVLQEDSYAAGYPKSFLVLDNSDIDAMLQIIYEERGLTLRDMTFSMARDMIEIQKLFKRPEYYRDMIALPLEALKEKYDAAARAEDIIFFGYLYQEKKCFGLDYNDLIKFTLHIFKEREDKDLIDIDATIICEKASHKPIIIGKGGMMIKKIGSYAREDIEKMLETRVNLQLFVKVKERWRDSEYLIKNFGFDKKELQ